MLAAGLLLLQTLACAALYVGLEVGVRRSVSATELIFLHQPVSLWLSWLVFNFFLGLQVHLPLPSSSCCLTAGSLFLCLIVSPVAALGLPTAGTPWLTLPSIFF